MNNLRQILLVAIIGALIGGLICGVIIMPNLAVS